MKLTAHVVASSLLVTWLLPAQGPGPQPVAAVQPGHRLPSLRTPIHTAPADRGIEYGIWAAGDSYKASFHDGMTFVPYLGSGYPVTQSLHWQTNSARLGTHELLEPGPVPVQEQWRYEYRFGALIEAYDVRSEGLEQTFVLQQRPAAGDLVIRGVVTSRLHSRNVAAAHQALVFADDQGHELVEYGKAMAFDARGEAVPVDTSYTDGAVTLTVPGAWLARAALPVTVDPLLAHVQVGYWGGADGQVEDLDIARNDHDNLNNVMITYTRSVSATDSDLWARLVNDDFGSSLPSGNIVFVDITTNWTTDQVSCAYVGGTDRWALVFRRLFTSAAVPTSELRAHVRNGAITSLLNYFIGLVPPAGVNDWRPDVGGVQAGAAGNDALVVFQREDNSGTGGGFANSSHSFVGGCLLDTAMPFGAFGAPFGIKPYSLYDNERPSVNQVAEGGASFSWVCVFQRFLDGVPNEDWDLVGARIAQNGAVAPGEWASDFENASPSQHQLGPVVEGTAGRYAVAFTTVDVASANMKTLSISGKQVQVERFDWADGANAPDGDRAPFELDTAVDRRFQATGIGFDTHDRSHWAVVYREVAPAAPALNFARVGFRGHRTEGVTVIGGNGFSRAACVFDNDNRQFLCAYGVDDGTIAQPVNGRAFVYDVPAPPVAFGTSCSTAALSWNGNQQIGAEFNRVEVSGAPPNAIHVMLASLAPDNQLVVHPIVAPGCRLFVDAFGPGYLGSFPVDIGASASWQLPLPEYLVSQDLFFQDWYLNAAGILHSTERLTVPIVK